MAGNKTGNKKRIPRPIHNPLMTMAGATAVGHEEAASIMLPFDALVDALRRGWVTDAPVGEMGSYMARLNRYMCICYSVSQAVRNAAMMDRARDGLTAICSAIKLWQDAGSKPERPVICTGNELRAVMASANMLAVALPHVSCAVWEGAVYAVADSAMKIKILMGDD